MKYRKSTVNQPTEFYTFINRRNLMKLFCLALISMCFIFSACDFRKVDAQTETNSKKGSNMESVQSSTTIQYTIPPIDAVTPSETETATFALG